MREVFQTSPKEAEVLVDEIARRAVEAVENEANRSPMTTDLQLRLVAELAVWAVLALSTGTDAPKIIELTEPAGVRMKTGARVTAKKREE